VSPLGKKAHVLWPPARLARAGVRVTGFERFCEPFVLFRLVQQTSFNGAGRGDFGEENEAFFSIDEFGPFSVRAQGSRTLVGPGEMPTVPQYQKSKGSLIMTAALELSQNQITYFYSPRKDTGEMLRMLGKLMQEYKNKSRIYLSWDAASWHMSKMLHNHVAEHNEAITKEEAVGPMVALAPLPSGAQFLNVIESVFSGMARAIIAHSNYGSIEEARIAIDRYVQERNEVQVHAQARRGHNLGEGTRTISVLGVKQL
jgi:hypothetical protein